MAPNRQKVVASGRPGRKPGRIPKAQSATPAPTPATAATPKLKLRLTFKPSAQAGTLPPVSAYRFPLSAPPSDDASEKEDAEDNTLLGTYEQGRRRGARQRTKAHAPDMVFGSEMDNLITSSATIGKTEDEEDVQMVSSPPTILSMRPPERYNSPDTIQGSGLPPPRYTGPVSQDVYDILNTLQSSSKIQVDLPDMFAPGGTGVVKPYTNSVLTQLYVQCYETQLWHFCDLIADTWIRALQKANKRTHKSKDVWDYMWRKNVALEKIFAEKKKGFKKDVCEFRLDVQDPDMDRGATDFSPERLRELYTHTSRGCGARLLWADAMALRGRKMENDIVKRPDVWPRELFFDVMCASLRMVGRKLTLKIEEKYEGAWCRYHEHVKHGLPCYRELAWMQKSGRKGMEDGDEEDEDGRRRGQGREAGS
ncbi:hypothetical protein BU25DRAFT_210486 [Macroventuria anomochaeta]|uniref:Uncharacterized protein n=1 Tax=Macroventuria anomochaeta TaxID=301207 RepID=A0ACB6RN55_9PLEO|nr:uncharacterized protein BU25DRAFT_210486 [Macroventuria anomochaeta]KAF2622538.1 hypothetical protein BU25DRAFT_210486 [Macroventuria anomochaeta]